MRSPMCPTVMSHIVGPSNGTCVDQRFVSDCCRTKIAQKTLVIMFECKVGFHAPNCRYYYLEKSEIEDLAQITV